MSFVTNPRRDASPTIAGFVFQVNATILRWIELLDDEHLELERGEDIDTVKDNNGGISAETRLLEQIKARSGKSLTLRSEEALEALSNFCLTGLLIRRGTLRSGTSRRPKAALNKAGVAPIPGLKRGLRCSVADMTTQHDAKQSRRFALSSDRV